MLILRYNKHKSEYKDPANYISINSVTFLTTCKVTFTTYCSSWELESKEKNTQGL